MPMWITMAWELGGGGGHLGRLTALADALEARGHAVELVCKTPDQAHAWGFGTPRRAVRAAPTWSPADPPAPPPRTWADILVGLVWADQPPGQLAKYVQAWERALLPTGAAASDVVVADYAPTAVLACRRLSLPIVTLGSGFDRPPNQSPLPDLRKLSRIDELRRPNHLADPIADDMHGERLALQRINPLIEPRFGQPLERLADLYAGVPDLRCTFPETDHFGPQPGVRHLGTFPSPRQEPPSWPNQQGGEGDGETDESDDAPRVFLYARHFPQLPALLGLLGVAGLPTAAFLSGLRPAKLPTNVALHDQPIDLQAAGAQADYAIAHAGLGTTTAMLRAGVPMLLLPLTLEQKLIATRAADLGAAVVADANDPVAIRDAFQQLLLEDRYAEAAQAFADKHADHDEHAALAYAADVVEAAARQDR